MAPTILLPVPVGDQRPLPELYPARVISGIGLHRGRIERITEEEHSCRFHPALLSFNSQRRYQQRGAYFNDYSCIYTCFQGKREPSNSAVRNKIRLGGTYDVEGEVIAFPEEKGKYIDYFL